MDRPSRTSALVRSARPRRRATMSVPPRMTSAPTTVKLPAPLRHRLDGPLRRRLAPQLQPGLEQHPQARGADGVAEALEAAVGVDGQLAVEVVGPGQDLLPAEAPLGEAEVLHEDELGGG